MGLPDLVITGRSGMLWRELKTEVGILTESQRYWGQFLTSAGEDWCVWRTSDLTSGLIVASLDRICL